MTPWPCVGTLKTSVTGGSVRNCFPYVSHLCHTHFSDIAGKYSSTIPRSPFDWKSYTASQIWKFFLNPFIKSTKLQITELGEIMYLMLRIRKLGLYQQAMTWHDAHLVFLDNSKKLCLPDQINSLFSGRLLSHSPFLARRVQRELFRT